MESVNKQQDEVPVKEYKLKPQIREYRRGGSTSLVIVLLFGLLAIFVEFFTVVLFSFNAFAAILLGFVLTICYIVMVFLFAENTIVREVQLVKIREVGMLEPIVDKVEGAIQKTDLIEQKKSKSDYIGSTLTNTFHKATCGFAKTIKPAFKVVDSDIEFFKKNKFKPCAVCITTKN